MVCLHQQREAEQAERERGLGPWCPAPGSCCCAPGPLPEPPLMLLTKVSLEQPPLDTYKALSNVRPASLFVGKTELTRLCSAEAEAGWLDRQTQVRRNQRAPSPCPPLLSAPPSPSWPVPWSHLRSRKFTKATVCLQEKKALSGSQLVAPSPGTWEEQGHACLSPLLSSPSRGRSQTQWSQLLPATPPGPRLTAKLLS